MESELRQQEKIRANNLKQLAAANIPIATGTDAGNIKTLHASSYYEELDYMQRAGLSNAEILRASTLTAAQLLNKDEPRGSIKVGNVADLVVLKSNPLEDLNALRDIAYVIKDGQLLDPDSILVPTPEQLAQQQLNAYNARDIDAFLVPYAENVAVYRFPNELQYTGKEKMRERYAPMFANTPELYCNLVNRIVQGDTVIDQELVTVGSGKQIEAIAIYKITEGKIQEVYFVY